MFVVTVFAPFWMLLVVNVFDNVKTLLILGTLQEDFPVLPLRE